MKKNSLLVKVAYFQEKKENIPKITNLCKFFRKLAFNLFYILIIYPCIELFFMIIIGLAFVITFLSANRLAMKNDTEDDKKEGVIKYKKWPKIYGHRIYPIWVFVLFFLGWKISNINFTEIGKIILHPYSIMLYFVIITIFSIGYLFISWKQSPSYILFKEFLRAKKEKICPLIEIVDE